MVSHSLEVVGCVAPGCENTNVLCPEKSFFVISCREERYHHWLLVCKREDLLESSTALSEFAICSDHFIDDHFEDKAHTKLKDIAVPTVFLSLEQALHLIPQESDSGDNVVCFKSEDNPLIIYDVNSVYEEENEFTDNEDGKKMQYLCRLCANVAEEMVYLFSSSEQNLARMINASLPVTVHNSDPLPKQLCSKCVNKVNMCHEFAEMCLFAEEKLLSLVKNNAFQAHHVTENGGTMHGIVASELSQNFSSITVVEGGSGDNNEKNSTSEFKTCDYDHNSCDRFLPENMREGYLLFSCPLCPEGTISVKNSEDFIENTDNISIVDAEENDFSQNTVNQIADIKCPFPNDISTTENLGTRKLTTISRKINCKDKIYCNSRNQEDNENLRRSDCTKVKDFVGDCEEKHNGIASFSQKILDNSDPIYCCVCQEAFVSLDVCLNHSKIHFNDSKYPCSVCNKVFSNENDHAHHCKLHAVVAKNISANGKRLKCDYCERRFNSQKTFFNHSCISSDPKQFRCSKCKKSYNTQERLLFHLKFHEGARQNFCVECGKEFDNEGTLYYHTRMVHVGERPFSCNTCGKKFYSNSRLVAHKRVHTGERPFECEVCGRRFYDRDTLKGHYVTHMAVKPFQCDFCGVCWGRKSLLNQHIRTHHLNDSSVSRRVPSLIHYYCKMCDTTFTNSTDVLIHRTTHWKTNSPDRDVNSNVHVCEYCGESFSLVAVLIKHRKQKHPDERPYVCSLCNVTSHTLYEARLHRNKHSLGKDVKLEEAKVEKSSSFICEACGNIFTEKRRFLRHMREHRRNHSYKCHFCEKQFIDNQRLTVHMRLHTGEKPYTCNVCGKNFSQTSALYTHALLHTGEKPHSCDLCGKAFRIKADRDNHRRTHTGEKPYKCEFCEKTFRTGQVYYQHRMIHTGERRFPCNICGKAFKRSHTLVVHKRIHTGEKPNICDICGKGFRQRSDMKKHRALHGTSD